MLGRLEYSTKKEVGRVLDVLCHMPEKYSNWSNEHPRCRRSLDQVSSNVINFLGLMGGALTPTPQAYCKKLYYIFVETSWCGMCWEMTKMNAMALVLRPCTLFVINRSINKSFEAYDSLAQRTLNTSFMQQYYRSACINLGEKDFTILLVCNNFGLDGDVSSRIYQMATEGDSLPPAVVRHLTDKQQSISSRCVSDYVVGSLVGFVPSANGAHQHQD